MKLMQMAEQDLPSSFNLGTASNGITSNGNIPLKPTNIADGMAYIQVSLKPTKWLSVVPGSSSKTVAFLLCILLVPIL